LNFLERNRGWGNGKLGTAIKPTYVPNPMKNYVQQADTTKAQRLLNFRAKVPLKGGIKQTLEYYKRLMK